MKIFQIIQKFLISRSRGQKTSLLIISDFFIFNTPVILLLIIGLISGVELIITDDIERYSLLKIDKTFFLTLSLFISIICIFFIYIFDGYKSFFRSVPASSFVGRPRLFSALIYFLFNFIVLLGITKNIQFSLISGLNFLFIVVFSFVIFRLLAYALLSNVINKNKTPILIYGAGQAGRETAASLGINERYQILGFIDDDKKLKNYNILGHKVIGNFSHIKRIKNQYANILVIIAMINITATERKRIISNLEHQEIHVKTIPLNYGALETRMFIENLRANDLIDRKIIEPNEDLLKKNIENKNVLVTGAGGSIGAEISTIVSKLQPKNMTFVDNSELNLFNLEKKFRSYSNFKLMKFILRDIQDTQEMENIIINGSIDSVFHAAAYKHVPLLQTQDNYKMAMKNNFFATYNLCSISMKNNVNNFTLISSDKAVNPTNIMGASKRLSELSLQAFQDLEENNTCFAMVRFGNVLNSSGSVVPEFWDQISLGGPVTVTHEDIYRFFMTIEEASNLVVQASSMAEGGEVFLLDMGDQIKIQDLAQRMIRLSGNSVANDENPNGIKIEFSGLRPGEKLYEELLLSNEILDTIHPKIKKGREKKYKFEEINNVKNLIEESIKNNDFKNLNIIISRFVDGYKFENEN